MYKIKFYVTPQGDCPFQSFLEEVSPKVKGKFIKFLDLLQILGPDLKRPYADVLREGIRELRIKFRHDQYRALYFFIHGKNIVITHGIIKKTDAVPPEEMERAI
jgi:phage-related protein